jgi:predicted metal-dependent enzyme (double-stranded beta helix superfamily)
MQEPAPFIPAMTNRLMQRLDVDTALPTVEEVCEAVKRTRKEEIVEGSLELPAELVQPVKEDYGRRLLHRHPEGRYAVVVMTWGPGQGTPIHDHAGKWCVECVYEGRIRVSSYDLLGERNGEVVAFHKASEVEAGKGAAGSLIPPFDFHVIENPNHETAVTIHVYGGEMEGCDVFTPLEDGRYRRQWRSLSYTGL